MCILNSIFIFILIFLALTDGREKMKEKMKIKPDEIEEKT